MCLLKNVYNSVQQWNVKYDSALSNSYGMVGSNKGSVHFIHISIQQTDT